MVTTEGAFLRDPLYNMLQIRDVKVSAHVKCIATAEEVKAKSVEELMAMAERANIKITEEQARNFFAKISGEVGEIADEDLGNIAGGCCIHFY